MTPLLYQVSFYAIAAVAVASALMVITRRNPVHSAVYLIITLLMVALLYLQLHAEFLATVQIILYIGGIMLLFLFVIMLVNLEVTVRQAPFNRQWAIAGLAAAVLLLEFVAAVYWGRESLPPPAASPQALQPNTELVGQVLFQKYLLPFEIASLLLLVAMVGAATMARRR